MLVPFTRELAQLSAEEFVTNRAIETPSMLRRIAVGTNFRFGHQRRGDAEMLERLAARRGVEVKVVPIVEDREGRMSSSRIRAALEQGDLTRQPKACLAGPTAFRVGWFGAEAWGENWAGPPPISRWMAARPCQGLASTPPGPNWMEMAIGCRP